MKARYVLGKCIVWLVIGMLLLTSCAAPIQIKINASRGGVQNIDAWKNKPVEIYLKDGSVIKGMVTANSTKDSLWVKIDDGTLNGGSVLAIKLNEVVKITHNPYENHPIGMLLSVVVICFAYFFYVNK